VSDATDNDSGDAADPIKKETNAINLNAQK
jgi:hypothetical protein